MLLSVSESAGRFLDPFERLWGKKKKDFPNDGKSSFSFRGESVEIEFVVDGVAFAVGDGEDAAGIRRPGVPLARCDLDVDGLADIIGDPTILGLSVVAIETEIVFALGQIIVVIVLGGLFRDGDILDDIDFGGMDVLVGVEGQNIGDGLSGDERIGGIRLVSELVVFDRGIADVDLSADAFVSLEIADAGKGDGLSDGKAGHLVLGLDLDGDGSALIDEIETDFVDEGGAHDAIDDDFRSDGGIDSLLD